MTEEETNRLALVLRECERIRAIMAEDEAARANGRDDGIPTGAPALADLPGGRSPDPALVAA